MYSLVSLLIVAFLPFAAGDKCKEHGGRCSSFCEPGTVAGAINDCAGAEYCCVSSKVNTAPQGDKAASDTGTPTGSGLAAPTKETTQKEHFIENILVCSPVQHKYVRSNMEPLACNSDYTSLDSLYKDGYRLIQIVDDGKKAIYYLEKK